MNWRLSYGAWRSNCHSWHGPRRTYKLFLFCFCFMIILGIIQKCNVVLMLLTLNCLVKVIWKCIYIQYMCVSVYLYSMYCIVLVLFSHFDCRGLWKSDNVCLMSVVYFCNVYLVLFFLCLSVLGPPRKRDAASQGSILNKLRLKSQAIDRNPLMSLFNLHIFTDFNSVKIKKKSHTAIKIYYKC